MSGSRRVAVSHPPPPPLATGLKSPGPHQCWEKYSLNSATYSSRHRQLIIPGDRRTATTGCLYEIVPSNAFCLPSPDQPFMPRSTVKPACFCRPRHRRRNLLCVSDTGQNFPFPSNALYPPAFSP